MSPIATSTKAQRGQRVSQARNGLPRLSTRRLWLRAIVTAGVLALWAIPVTIGLHTAQPVDRRDALMFVAQLLTTRSAAYLGYCPLPLVMYWAISAVARHPIALLLGLSMRRQTAAGFWARHRTFAGVTLAWAALAIGGALIVGKASSAGWGWTLTIASMTAFAGLPAISFAMACAARLRSSWTFWPCVVVGLLLLLLLAVGLRGPSVWPVVPGAIDFGLASGREPDRTLAMWGALGWLVAAWLCAACGTLVPTWARWKSARSGG